MGEFCVHRYTRYRAKNSHVFTFRSIARDTLMPYLRNLHLWLCKGEDCAGGEVIRRYKKGCNICFRPIE